MAISEKGNNSVMIQATRHNQASRPAAPQKTGLGGAQTSAAFIFSPQSFAQSFAEKKLQ
jgi:hypothetical protein